MFISQFKVNIMVQRVGPTCVVARKQFVCSGGILWTQFLFPFLLVLGNFKNPQKLPKTTIVNLLLESLLRRSEVSQSSFKTSARTQLLSVRSRERCENLKLITAQILQLKTQFIQYLCCCGSKRKSLRTNHAPKIDLLGIQVEYFVPNICSTCGCLG